MRGIVNMVVGILGPVLFRVWCRIFVEVMVCVLYEDVKFWSIHAMVFHYSVFFLLVCRLYLIPFSSKEVSYFEKVIFVF